MILCITEKPSVGADIARILGAGSRHDGYFEGNGYWVTWTFGHLCTLKEPADYTPLWKSWRLAYLPMIPPRFGIKIIPQKSVEHQFQVIESLIGKASEIINCGDAGQEGELIQRWVMQKAGCKIPVKRLWISSLTDDSIIDGFKHLKPQEDLQPLYEAGLCRAIGDWVLGINATRLYTLKYRDNGNGRDDRPILSVGRVQTPTLALIVKRQLEIENFVPKDTWEVKTIYRDTLFSSSLKPFESPEKAQKIVEEIATLPLQITDISKKKGTEAPPRLFDLTSLQVEANKKYGYSADDTLRTIQSLYEKKLTTYPRVDTTYLTDDIYPKCGQILMGMPQFQAIIDPLKGKALKKTKKVFDNSKVTDHHAIIPTGQPVPDNLSERELNVFNLVAKRFIAVFWPDCVFEQTTALAEVGKYKFKATGKVITNLGWKTVY
ncbi:MAG: DNA topoisomerase III, partial [Muribaculaceae bacterium]|nr:DNA topoisomerase III [Muribaculaceae bacterium]